MKITVKLVFLLFLITTNLTAHLVFTKEEFNYIKNNQVKVAMLPDLAPFSMYENGELKGYSYELLELISKKSGLKFIYEVDTWPNNLKKFKEKKVDLIDAISFKDKRLEFANFTRPYYEVPLVIFSKKDLKGYDGTLESLKGKKLGNTKNIFYKKQIENLHLFNVVEYDSFEEKLKGLAFGEVDIIFGHLLSTQIAIEKSQYTNMKVLGELNLPNLNKTDLRFGITKDNELLNSIINKTFTSINQNEWSVIYNKWISLYTQSEKTEYKTIVNLTRNERDFLIKKDIKCVISNNWAPFYHLEENKKKGLSIDYWELVKRKTLIKSQCKVVDSFHKALSLIKEKKADVLIATAMTKNRMEYATFSKPYLSFPIAIATSLEQRYIADTSALIGKKVAIGKSFSSYEILKEKYPGIEFVEVKDNLEALEMLSQGEVFATADILPVLSHMISEYGFKNIKISGITDFNFDVRFMVRDDYTELVPIINKGINAVSKVELETIKNKWLTTKVENVFDYSRLWQIGIIVSLILIILFYRQVILNNHNRKLQEANLEIEVKTIELQRKTKQLAKQKELFEKIYKESTDGICLIKLSDKSIIDCNTSTYKMLGLASKEEFLKHKISDFLPNKQPDGSDSIDIVYKMIDKAVEHGSSFFELVHKKDDKPIWLEVVFTPITIDDVELIHTVLRNVDDRKHLEKELNTLTLNLEDKVKQEVKKNEEKTKQLIQQSRLAQMGEMISMIAHQWRQPLTAISATTNSLVIRMMLNEKVDNKEFLKEINLISDYSQHLSMTIDDFRNFFKSNKEKTNTTIEEVLTNSINIVKKSFENHNVTLETNFNCNKNIRVFASELNQVVLNLLKNAEDAILDNSIKNGKIEIKSFIEDNCCVVEISDNAGGIPEDIMDKIFDPYFSTKKEKEGTGLGLYMSKIIVNEHSNGDLSVKNSETGAIFRLQIPL